MGETTKIQWTSHTWNPWQGCAKVSPGCDNCYMFRDKKRYGQNPLEVVRSRPATFNKPLRWNREAKERGISALVFVASWADFFSREADDWRGDAWDIIRECDSLIFQVLTKRHARIAANLPEDWGDGYENVWLGVSAEDRIWLDRRVGVLKDVPAHTKFVSYEPALGPIGLDADLFGIDWLIIGGESGPGARPFDVGWASDAIKVCRANGVAPFVKQLGAHPYSTFRPPGVPIEKVGDRFHWKLVDSHGGDIDEWTQNIAVREFPKAVAA